PLANPQQAGILLQAGIYQAFGNWQGTEQTLDLILKPPTNGNYPFTWTKGQSINQALQNTLGIALPGVTVTLNLTQNIVAPETQSGHYGSLTEFATAVNALTKAIVGGTYPGIWIALNKGKLNVFDINQPASGTIALAFTDLIGQPTWISLSQIIVKTVLRADIGVGNMISLPRAVVQNQPQSLAGFRNALDFSGNYSVVGVRHAGHYKQHDANSWATILTCTALPASV